jgi:hypothetical protein
MSASVYDADLTGVVDNSQRLNWQYASFYVTQTDLANAIFNAGAADMRKADNLVGLYDYASARSNLSVYSITSVDSLLAGKTDASTVSSMISSAISWKADASVVSALSTTVSWKSDDSAVVHKTGNIAETITWLKTFSAGQVVISQDWSNNSVVRYTNSSQDWYVWLRGDSSNVWSIWNASNQLVKVFDNWGVGIGAYEFLDSARFVILGRERIMNWSGKRVMQFGPNGTWDRGAYLNFQAHHATDGSSIEWTFYADRDSAIVWVDTLALWCYPKDTWWAIVSYNAPLIAQIDRATGKFSWTFTSGDMTVWGYVNATDIRVTAGIWTVHSWGGRLLVWDRPYGSIVAQAGWTGAGKVFALIDNAWTRVPVQFSYDAPNNSLVVEASWAVWIWVSWSASYKLDIGGSVRIQWTGKLLTIGDDVSLYDVNQANTLQIAGDQNSATAILKLGTGGAAVQGNADGTLTLVGYSGIISHGTNTSVNANGYRGSGGDPLIDETSASYITVTGNCIWVLSWLNSTQSDILYSTTAWWSYTSVLNMISTTPTAYNTVDNTQHQMTMILRAWFYKVRCRSYSGLWNYSSTLYIRQ